MHRQLHRPDYGTHIEEDVMHKSKIKNYNDRKNMGIIRMKITNCFLSVILMFCRVNMVRIKFSGRPFPSKCKKRRGNRKKRTLLRKAEAVDVRTDSPTAMNDSTFVQAAFSDARLEEKLDSNAKVKDERAVEDDSMIIERVDSSVCMSSCSNSSCSNSSCSNSSLCEGRRIVDIPFLMSEIHRVFDDHSRGIECRFNDWKLIKTFRRGLLTQLFFRCDVCHYEASVWSEPTDKSDMLDVNVAGVAGTITSGIGFYQFEELLAAMNIPSMTEKSYIKYREDVIDMFAKTAEADMKAAGELEKQLAVERGDIINGIPYITVIVDGSWMKRSYGMKYDSLSGVGAIVGYHTGKVLFVGVRNKFCAVCDIKKSTTMDHPRPHACYKNFDLAANSAAMEADAIVEGFNSSIEMHGLMYKTFVADGDSNVYKSIRDNDPYREQMVQVQKIECTNHLLRNLCKKLRAVSEMTQPKGKKLRGFYETRAIIKKNIFNIRMSVMNCITSRQQQTSSQHVKEAELQRDLLNIPNHIFGQHARCADRNYKDTCNNENGKHFVPYLKLHGFYNKIETAIRYLSAHSASLILNVTSNAAESFHSIVCKNIAGKRINFGARGSYNARVNSAVVQFNRQQVLTDFYAHSEKEVPSAVENLEKRRKHKISQTRLNRMAKESSKSFDKPSKEKNMYYGLHSQKPDLPNDVFDRLKEDHFQKLQKNSQDWEEIERNTRDQVNSELWMTIRKQMLTASKFGLVCRMRPTTSCAVTVKNILYPPVMDVAALQYGRHNEENARKELEKILNKKIEVCGLFVDREIPYFGASPDGLIDDDGLVEIKCPSSAENSTAEDAIINIRHLRNIFDKKNNNAMNMKHPHFYQVQGQLHVTQRKFCMYAIWTPKSVVTLRVDKDDNFWEREMKDRLVRFYEECLLPELLDPRYVRSMPIRDPPSILHAQEEARIRKQKIQEQRNSKAALKKEAIERDSSPDISIDDDCVMTECLTNDNTSEDTLNKRRKIIDGYIASIDIIRENVLPIMGRLNDESLDRFLRVVRETSAFETQSVLYVAYSHLVTPTESCKSLQIIGGNCSDHWRCVFFDGCKLFVYDSLPACTYDKLSRGEKQYIALRYPSVKKSNIFFPRVAAQPDSWSCGVYAAAFATTVVLEKDPSNEKYSMNAARMRHHFVQIIESGKLSHFPAE